MLIGPVGGQSIFSKRRGTIGFFKASAKLTSRRQFAENEYFCVTHVSTILHPRTPESIFS
jgi:hypothetical protein